MEDLIILVIEDEALVALEIVQTIQSLGYQKVYFATSIKKAKKVLEEYPINLFIMDINLKGEYDGISFYQELNSKIPIIYLTAYKDDITMQRAIETNPIGYLIKPYRNEELKALLLLAKHRATQYTVSIPNEKIELGKGYFFDTVNKHLLYNNEVIYLGKKELQLLMLLIASRGTTVSYYTIEHEIWGSEPISSSTIRTLIYRLRGKLHHNLIQSKAPNGICLE